MSKDEFRSGMELLLQSNKEKLDYYQKRIDDYVQRSERVKEQISSLEKALAAKV